MVYISRLKLRNFKSFKAASIQLPRTFTCFAGPNGSGKSNLCDAIRFAMGEKSLKSLRAKIVRDLIHSGARSAEVSILFDSEDGGPSYEIKRAIREDGKIRYRLNEKKATRSAILEALKRHNLDESGRNTIAQGEVQRIISMNGKERRGIIDSVAGIADFEAKKKEAMGELDMVDTRIKEARLVLGERKAFLDELGREKEVALRYIDAKKTLTNAKGTLLRNEVGRLEKELSEALGHEERLLAGKAGKDKEMAAVEGEIAEVDRKRAGTAAEMQARQKTNALIRRLEELKASVGSKKQLVADKEAAVKGMRSEKETLAGEIDAARKAVAALEEGMAALEERLGTSTQELASAGGPAADERITGLRNALESQEKALSAARERLVSLDSEITAKRELIAAKKEEAASITPAGLEEEESEDLAAIRRGIDDLAREIDRSFTKTKEINAQISDLDRQMLELKEKASIFKVRSSPHLANPALSFISDLAKLKGSGILGTVADLISFDAEYSSAVEAAGGARLLYVVVDGVDTATEVIGKLKAAKAGRATFIPLDRIKTPPPARSGKFSSVLDVIAFKEEARRAMEYVFADTLLVDTAGDAKKLGVGTMRMVTREGEIFERSGIVSGGRTQSSLLSANQIRKIEEELNSVKGTKDALISELYSIRENESRLRAEKSQLEILIKTAEMKQKMDAERRKEHEHVLKRKDQLAKEISALESSVDARTAERGELAASIGRGEGEIEGQKGRLRSAEAEFLEKSQESSKRRADLSAEVSSLKATIEGRLSEIKLRKAECAAREERFSRLGKEEKDSISRIDSVRKEIKESEAELAGVEEKISSASSEIEKLFEEMKAHEEALQELGRKRGQVRLEMDRLGRDLNQLSIRKATATTRLEDLKAEFASYGEAEPIDAGKDELARMIGESERTLAELGNVNMAAIEMFDRKKAEIDDVEGRIGKLETEREAILSMISEIDEHKKDAFFEAFNAISDNFGKMFNYVNIGQGHLYLSEPSDPFESGLFIKLRRNNQDHSLDALSGGEKTLVALMFIFALQLFKPAPFYILDEVDAALDKPNSKNLADLVAKMSNDSQFIVVSHNDTVMSNADSVIGVTKSEGASKLVGIKLRQAVAQV
jgi:chromosome segregation protein